VATEATSEWTIDYESIIGADLAKQPSRVWPGLGFAIPMSVDECRGFPRIPAWKYEWDIRRGADVQIRPFGSRYRIRVEPRSVEVPCEIRSIKRKDVAALKAAFAEAFNGYTDYLYRGEQQLLKLGSAVFRDFFALGKESLCRRASCLAVDPENPTRVIGAALLAHANRSVRKPPEVATQLQPVFVIPEWRRRGVATALVAEVLRRLSDAGQQGSPAAAPITICQASDFISAWARWRNDAPIPASRSSIGRVTRSGEGGTWRKRIAYRLSLDSGRSWRVGSLLWPMNSTSLKRKSFILTGRGQKESITGRRPNCTLGGREKRDASKV
jgi:ribosomal protein S18 acetylase RimI-like enzyme